MNRFLLRVNIVRQVYCMKYSSLYSHRLLLTEIKSLVYHRSFCMRLPHSLEWGVHVTDGDGHLLRSRILNCSAFCVDPTPGKSALERMPDDQVHVRTYPSTKHSLSLMAKGLSTMASIHTEIQSWLWPQEYSKVPTGRQRNIFFASSRLES